VASPLGQVRVTGGHGVDLRFVDEGHASSTTALGPAEPLLLDGRQLGGDAAELAVRTDAGERYYLG